MKKFLVPFLLLASFAHAGPGDIGSVEVAKYVCTNGIGHTYLVDVAGGTVESIFNDGGQGVESNDFQASKVKNRNGDIAFLGRTGGAVWVLKALGQGKVGLIDGVKLEQAESVLGAYSDMKEFYQELVKRNLISCKKR